MRKLLLFVWLPFALFLLPLPPQAGKQLMEEAGAGRAPVVGGSEQKTDSKIEPTRQQKAAQDGVVSALWTVWTQHLIALILGLCVGILAWRGHRYWRVSALVLSVLYLAVVAIGYVHSERPVPDGLLFFGTDNSFLRNLQFNIRLVESGISNGSFVRPARIAYANILMPIFQAVVLGWLLWFYLRSKPR
jgi:hypothetical protein